MLKLRSATAIIAIVTTAVSAIAILFLNLGVAATLWGFTPAAVGGNLSHELAIPWWITPFTSALLHGSWLHLIVNMAILLFVGSQVERVVGGAAMLFAYIIGAMAACTAIYAVTPASFVPLIGASGAISVLVGLYALFFGRPKQVTRNMKLNRAIHVLWLLATWVVIQLLIALATRQGDPVGPVAGHIAGFLLGLILQRPLLLWRYRKA